MSTVTMTATGGAGGVVAALAAERRKLFAARATYVKLGLAVLLAVGMSVLACSAVGASGEFHTPGFDPVSLSMAGAMFSGILFAVLGATAVTSEYSSGMIGTTLAAVPRRVRVLAAKAVVVGVVVLAVGAVTQVAMFVVGQAVLSGFGAPSVGFGDDGVPRAVLSAALTTPVDALLALGLGFLLRSAAGAITAELALMMLPAMFGGLLPAWWQEHVLNLLPVPAGNALSGLSGTPGSLPALVAALVLAGWVAAALLAGGLRLTRCDT